MDNSVEKCRCCVALIGNPNTGKSTLFTTLCGVRQRIGNYPGVTVEKRLGSLAIDGTDFTFIDLPGTYSLAPRAPDEVIAVDVLLGQQTDVDEPDVVLCIVDASNLERNLYLLSQLLELDRPIVVALNMMDLATAAGLKIDVDRLSQQLGVPVIPLVAHRKKGTELLKQAIQSAASSSAIESPRPFPTRFYEELQRLEEAIIESTGTPPRRYLVERLLLDSGGYLEEGWPVAQSPQVRQVLIESRANLAEAGIPVPAVEAMSRYDWVGQLLEGTLTRTAKGRVSWSDRLDRVLTHRLIGTCFFAALMVLVFQSIFTWAGPLTGWIELGMGEFGGAVEGMMPEGLLRSLLVDGIIAGVGAVLVFLPQIAILFLFLAILEDCGYMARAAFLMDRLMVAVGLNGRAFIPLLSSFACAIPGIMATRVIENRRDRLTTILIAPLMSCSARLPVYFLLAAAFIPDTKLLGGWLGLQGITIAAMYFLGIFVAIAAAWIFRRFLFPGPTPPLVMELPAYKWPSLQVVLTRVSERAWSFIRRAGTMILAVTILVWAAVSFPKSPELDREIARPFNVQLAELKLQQKQQVGSSEASPSWEQRIVALEANRDAAVQSAAMRHSVLGRMGRAIEPLVRPLGWDWRIGCAVIASFPAREVVIGAMGVIYKLGEGQDGASESLKGALKQATWDGTNRLVFNIPVALSLMVFFSLCAQCAATLAVIRRETNSWRWPVFAFSYMTLLAYVAAWMTYQVGELCFS